MQRLLPRTKNPWLIGDSVALTQTSGWVDAWTSAPSAYAVAARNAADVAAAVNFARTHRLRLVVKGGGHSYQGTSNAADSLLAWTRPMNAIELHDGFVGRGCTGAPQPAISLGAGNVWLHAYAAAAKAGRYVQGGVIATIQAKSDSAYRALIERFVAFYRERLFDPQWGEQVAFRPDNTLGFAMVFQGLDEAAASAVWRPFFA